MPLARRTCRTGPRSGYVGGTGRRARVPPLGEVPSPTTAGTEGAVPSRWHWDKGTLLRRAAPSGTGIALWRWDRHLIAAGEGAMPKQSWSAWGRRTTL